MPEIEARNSDVIEALTAVHRRVREVLAGMVADSGSSDLLARHGRRNLKGDLLYRFDLTADEVICQELAARLPPLLAYEARVTSVREWPFDTATLARFLVFLLVPLGSWLGGALVERLVDTLLD